MAEYKEGDQVGGKFAYPIWQSQTRKHGSGYEVADENTQSSSKDIAEDEKEADFVHFPWLQRRERFKTLSVFNEPQCLITINDKGVLEVNESIVNEIELIDVPLSVVAITGLYRTGKSYLMNKIAGCQNGFSLGNSVQSHTKGIWAFCCIHPLVDQQVIMYLDTEGLADVKKGNSDHDNRIFSLAVLMSSTLIYNAKDVFNADDMQKLTFIAQLSDNIKAFGDTEKDKAVDKAVLMYVSPIFVLCLRDHFLEMDKTADEYFEDCLSVGENNEIAECIKQYFPRRRCFTIEQPAMGKTLRQLSETNDSELSKTFISDVKKLKDYIERCGAKHVVSNRPIDGLDFISLMTTYVSELNTGIPMNLEEAVISASIKHNEKVYTSVLRWLRNEITFIPLPIPLKEVLQTKFFQLQDEMIRLYRKDAYPYGSDCLEAKLQEKMIEQWKDLRLENSVCITKRCKTLLRKLDTDLMKDEEFYNRDGMYQRFKDDIRHVEKMFYEQMNGYDKDELIDPIEDYKDSKKGIKAELSRKEGERTLLKQREHLEKRLEERFQEKCEAMEREKNEYIEKERDKIFENMLKQQEMSTRILTETIGQLHNKSAKRGCIIS
ncbi:guanylate-binding protein 2-like [Ruditapes philippinarum]|uniref:guanylate-binding protein 2-like n=1 Tax=Ruditapes philippinarum TaxID=129788 RepID=UPI00295B0667|nr:guanylate-binding protein 2-like [Ruditapes philippinarum]XP_060586550.1 guanylate-binding protein 2-like [Ruditapes philippinarum]XP_060586551.1 guanylate-binding protein 2-like [Ruditapes philippinarum]